MAWRSSCTNKLRKARASMLRDIREFFYQRDVLEVETPALSNAGNTDPFIQLFQCTSEFSGKKPENRYLHTSPEYAMKRLLADGSGDIYQICKVWRREEAGKLHNPEFTLLEWYRVGFTYQQLMQEVEALLLGLLPECISPSNFIAYDELFLNKFGFNPHSITTEHIESCVAQSINGLATKGLDTQAMLDALFTHCIEPEFENGRLTFVYDYPETQSALATLKKNDGYKLAERFEVYYGPLELGNGYQEETSYTRNKQIQNNENQARTSTGSNAVAQDRHFLQACESGIPEAAGVAIGLDRVLMCITGEKSIEKVINFPWDRA